MLRILIFELQGTFMKQLIFMMLMFVGATASAQLYINEVMASNREGIYDDFFERDDWIEIYNSGGIQNLAGYYLSDRADSLDLWQFPSTNAGLTTVLPNNHLLVIGKICPGWTMSSGSLSLATAT